MRGHASTRLLTTFVFNANTAAQPVCTYDEASAAPDATSANHASDAAKVAGVNNKAQQAQSRKESQ